ncbi:RING finger protein unkempt-like [Holothuria leucospilota]|uniref:RING finger protein unkempt-like n=1 Tax=Holothuria leucospilota TaxID=206669 RepID=A0A9Q1C2A6_HOLLE|nr:RING finger protein unkempt-like [Holothuria leucospilota]
MQMYISRAQAKSKMPSEQVRNSASNAVVTPVEKPFHYTYLKEFRTQQCQDFLQHKCPNHRPFTCFHWHFLNQRRRRPIRKRDGTFNYSPDVYCTKYDDTTGMCPDGDDCQYLHRNTGDTERRYHLRYYKTGTCVHETDTRGHCVKNGPHCAFAHGPHDLRQPVYDIREMSAQTKSPTPVPETTTSNGDSIAGASSPSLGSTSDKDKAISVIVDDPQWNDTIFVLANYKTEQCKRPPRLCRQGYACPQYHNARDRRRSPMVYRYRSTPCPNVKHGDEWGEISNCEQEDMCQYCHTRTEQQFHPEIYKSTKCNDMQQTGYCPRGPFCAFAHVEQEMSSQRDFTQELGNLATSSTRTVTMPGSSNVTTLGQHIGLLAGNENQHLQQTTGFQNPSSGLGPIGKPRSNSASSSYSSESSHLSSTYPKNVTSSSISDNKEETTNSVFSHGTSLGQIMMQTTQGQGSSSYGTNSGMSASAMPFYPPSDTVGSVIGNALDDLNLEDFDVSALDRELDNDNSSVGSSGASVSQMVSGRGIPSTTAPVNIPGGGTTSVGMNHKSSVPESPASPLSQLPPAFVPQHIQQQQQQQQQIEQAAAAFMSRPNTTPLSSLRLGSILEPLSQPPGSPGSGSGRSQHNLMSPGRSHNPGPEGDHQRLQEEVQTLRNKLQTWEESWHQAKQACDAWKQEASDWAKKAEILAQEKQASIQSKEEAVQECLALKQEVDGLTEGSHLHVLNKVSKLQTLPLSKLRQLQTQLRTDLEKLEKVIHVREFLCCLVCRSSERNVAVLPCYHVVFCSTCASSQTECPTCHQKIMNRTKVVIPF